MVSPGQIHLSCSVACWAAAWVSCGVRVNMRSAKRPSVAERNRLWENSSIPSNWGVQRSSNLGVHQILNTCSVHRGRSVSENLSLALPLSLWLCCVSVSQPEPICEIITTYREDDVKHGWVAVLKSAYFVCSPEQGTTVLMDGTCVWVFNHQITSRTEVYGTLEMD